MLLQSQAPGYLNTRPAIVLVAVLVFLSACATGPSRAAREEPPAPALLEQFEGLSAAEIAATGDQAAQDGELERAVFIYMQSLAVADDADIWMKVGRIQQHSGQTIHAWQSFERVVFLNPESAEGHERLGMLYLESRQKDRAEYHLNKAIGFDSTRWSANNVLGILADSSHDYERAIGHYEAALEHQPKSALLLTNLGYSHYLAGKPEEAEQFFIMAIGIDRAYEPATANLGLARARRGEYDSAVEILENVMPRQRALNDVGYIAFVNGDVVDAERLLSDAARASPTYYQTAHENLEKVKAARAASRPRAEDVNALNGPDQNNAGDIGSIEYRIVNADRLNVRRADSNDAPIIGFLAADNRVRVLTRQGEWSFVASDSENGANSISGWVVSGFLSDSATEEQN